MNREKIKSFLGNKYIEPVKKLLMQGTTPSALALGISGALVIGLFPVLGSTTLLCALFALVFRLNLPLIQLINFSVYPLQLIMLIPFMKLGEKIFGVERLYYSLSDIVELISTNQLKSISILWNITMQAIGAWFITAPIVAVIIYFLVHKLLRKI